MLGVLTAASAGAGRVAPAKPTLVYAGSGTTNNGKFTIENYDASLTYTVTGGTRSGATITVTDANGTASVTARSGKSVSESPAGSAQRKAATQYRVVTSPSQCYYSGSCASQCGGCGTYYAAGAWAPGSAAGFYSCCDQGYYVYDNYTGSGYTWGGSDYTNGQGEWWKIS